jgi:hypothetical protein
MSDESFLNIEVQDISDEEASLITDSPLWQTLSDRQQETIQGGMLDVFSKKMDSPFDAQLMSGQLVIPPGKNLTIDGALAPGFYPSK